MLNTIYITVWADYELSTPGVGRQCVVISTAAPCCCEKLPPGTEVQPDQAVEWAFSAFYCSLDFGRFFGGERVGQIKSDTTHNKDTSFFSKGGLLWPEQKSF